jgi:putative membrane protein
MWYYQYYWGMAPLWWIVWFIILIWIFALPFNIPGQRYHREAPLDILKKRYARGEIDHQEYEQKKEASKKNDNRKAPYLSTRGFSIRAYWQQSCGL